MSRYYTHSGKFNPASLALALIGASIAGALGGFIYGILDCWNPIIYLNLLVVFFGGFGIGIIANSASNLAHNRSGLMRFGLAIIVGLVALAAAWYGWLWALFNHKEWPPLDPASLWKIIVALSERGVWSVGRGSKEPVSGIALQLVWAIEACMILGITVFTCLSSTTPYCETCGNWTEEEKGALTANPAEDMNLFKRALEDENYEVLTLLSPVTSLANFIAVDLHLCKNCTNGPHYMSLRKISVTQDANGKDQTNTEDLVTNLMIDQSVVDSVRQQKNRLDVETMLERSENEPENSAPTETAEPGPDASAPA
jgi:hypothetical protein